MIHGLEVVNEKSAKWHEVQPEYAFAQYRVELAGVDDPVLIVVQKEQANIVCI